MPIFLILFIALIIGTIGLSVGFMVFKKLQRRQQIESINNEPGSDKASYNERQGNANRVIIHPILGAFIAMICSIAVICVLVLIAYIIFIIWIVKDMTLF